MREDFFRDAGGGGEVGDLGVGDFEDGGGLCGERVKGGVDVEPIDGAGGEGGGALGSAGGPEVDVGAAVVVGEVELGDAGAEELDDLCDGLVGRARNSEVRVGYVEADAAGIEVAHAQDFKQVLGRGDGVREVFEQQLYAQRCGEGFEVLDGGEGVLEGVFGPLVALRKAEVQDAGGGGDGLGQLQRALDFFHGVDAPGLVCGDEVERRRGVAGEVLVGGEGGMERGGDATVAEPCGELAGLLAVGVIDVVARGEELDDGGAGSGERVKVRGGEALRVEEPGREAEDHCVNRVPRAGVQVRMMGMDQVQGGFRRDLLVLCVCSLPLLLVHFWIGDGYGFHRDELQFLSDARHLDWGFTAYPPMTALLGRLSVALFGISPQVFRLPAALVNMVSVVLAGLVARELGGARIAQVLAALAMLPLGLAFGSVLQYNTPDLLAWMIVLLFTTRVLATGDGRNWLGAGLGIGLGVQSKYSIAFLAASLLVGLITLPSDRRWFSSRWFWYGIVVATVVAAPNLIWLAIHGFITLKMETYIHARDVRLGRADGYFTDQLKYTLLALPLAVAGMFWLVRNARFRLLTLFYVGPFVLFALAKGRGYYLLPAYPVLYSAGAVAFERWAAGLRTGMRAGAQGMVFGAMLVDAIAVSGIFLPMFAPGSAAFAHQVKSSSDLADEVGWPEFVQQVAAVRDGLAPGERERLAVLANNYGEAGALELYGPQYGLPGPISSTNSFHARGYGAFEPENVIVVGDDLDNQLKNFEACRVAARVVIPYGVWNEEARDHQVILVCRHLRGSWPAVWAKSQEFG